MDDELLFRVMTGAAGAAEVEAVEAWRGAAPENEARYRSLLAILGVTSEADAARGRPAAPRAGALLLRAKHGRLGRGAPEKARVWLGWGGAAVAAVAVAVAVASTLSGPPDSAVPQASFGAEEFVAGPSEIATVSLRDGTVVRLAPGSRLRVAPGHDRRQVTLTGRGYFAVAKDPASPFVIRTSAGDVTVLGTRFDLSARSEDLQLVVTEGRVSLSANGQQTEVEAGEMGKVLKGKTLPVVRVPDVLPHMDWVGRFLAFQATPLEDAILEIERQYAVRIEITDPALASRTITTWLADWTLEDVMAAVCGIANAACSTRDGVIVMEPR